MGGAPCWIVINCGDLGSAAKAMASLYSSTDDAASEVRALSTYLAGVQDEACEIGDKLEPFLTVEDKTAIIEEGRAADKLRVKIMTFIRTGRKGKDALVRRDALVAEMDAFADRTHGLFLGLADKYKDE